MLPVLSVTLDGQPAVEVQTDTLGMWCCEDIMAKPLNKASEYGIRLILAYIGVTGEEPKNLADVKAWAKEHKVQVTVGDMAVPTTPAPTAG